MSELTQEKGSYNLGPRVRVNGSFKTEGASAPDVLRDGGAKIVKSVARTSQGLYLVTIDSGFPMPELPEIRAWKDSSATPARGCVVHYVADSWSKTARTFSIVCFVVADTAYSAYQDPVVQDPDTGDRISFEITGSISGVGTDPA